MRPVHIAVTQQVKPGKEREFAEAIKEFARESLGFPGNTGVHLIEPVPGTDGTEFGILRSFESDAARKAFYESKMFAGWLERSVSMIAAKPVFRELQGIEAFFPAQSAAPPRWKMAILTFIAVYPTVLFWSVLVSRRLPDLPWPVTVAVNNVLVVITLAWAMMPLLTKLFAGWLRPRR